jgi:hypothetical protein
MGLSLISLIFPTVRKIIAKRRTANAAQVSTGRAAA